MFDYKVINYKQSQIDLYWKSSTDQKRDIIYIDVMSGVEYW